MARGSTSCTCALVLAGAAASRPEDQLATLRSSRGTSRRAASSSCELRSLTAIDWSQEPSALRHEWTRTDPETGERITKLPLGDVVAARQTTLDTLIFDRLAADGTVRRRDVRGGAAGVRAVRSSSCCSSAAGLRVSNVYGGADLSPFDDASDTLFIVAGLA